MNEFIIWVAGISVGIAVMMPFLISQRRQKIQAQVDYILLQDRHNHLVSKLTDMIRKYRKPYDHERPPALNRYDSSTREIEDPRPEDRDQKDEKPPS